MFLYVKMTKMSFSRCSLSHLKVIFASGRSGRPHPTGVWPRSGPSWSKRKEIPMIVCPLGHIGMPVWKLCWTTKWRDVDFQRKMATIRTPLQIWAYIKCLYLDSCLLWCFNIVCIMCLSFYFSNSFLSCIIVVTAVLWLWKCGVWAV